MLPYMGIVLQYDGVPDDMIHQRVYEEAQIAVSPATFALMTDSTHTLRNVVRRHPDKFIQYLAFFRVKPLYTYSSFLCFKAGASLTRSVFFPSLIGYWLTAVIFFIWLLHYYNAIVSAMVTAVAMVFPPLLEAARLATPDMLACSLIVLSCYLFDRQKPMVWIMVVLTFAVLARIDSIVIIMTAMVFYAVRYKVWSQARVTQVVLALYLAALSVYSVWLFLHVNDKDGLDAFYGSLSEKFSVVAHCLKIVKGLATIQANYILPFVIIGGVMLWLNARENFIRHHSWWLVVTVGSVAKYLLFPDLTTRFFLPLYFLSLIFIFIEMNRMSVFRHKLKEM